MADALFDDDIFDADIFDTEIDELTPSPPIPPQPAEYYTVIVSAGVGGQATPAGSNKVLVGINFTVHATANTDYVFSYWTRNGVQVSTNPNYTILGGKEGMANMIIQMVAYFTYSPPIPPPNLTRYEYYNTGDQHDVNITAVYWIAQTFTVGNLNAHTVASVNLKLYRGGSPGTLTVSIRATANGHPTGADLATGTMNGNNLTNNSAGGWYNITLNEYTLSSNTKYAIVCRCEGTGSDTVCWRINALYASYTGGNLEYSGNSGSSWESFTDYDCMFEVWGNPISAPTPAFTVIISSSTGGSTTPSGTQTSNVGTPMSITATADGGYTFSHWLRNGSVYSTSNPVPISGYANQTIRIHAIFEANPPPEPPTPPVPSTYTVNIEAVTGGSTNYTGVQTVDAGKSLTVRAEPNSNYAFRYWLLDNVNVSSNPFYTITGTAGSTYNLHPVFQYVPPPPPSSPQPPPPSPISPPPEASALPPVTIVGTLGGTLLPTLIGKFEKQKPINFNDLINTLKKANL